MDIDDTCAGFPAQTAFSEFCFQLHFIHIVTALFVYFCFCASRSFLSRNADCYFIRFGRTETNETDILLASYCRLIWRRAACCVIDYLLTRLPLSQVFFYQSGWSLSSSVPVSTNNATQRKNYRTWFQLLPCVASLWKPALTRCRTFLCL